METDVKRELKLEDALKYLTLYLGAADWPNAIGRLQMQVHKRVHGGQRSIQMREIISCAIMMPLYEGTKPPAGDPTKVLMWAQAPSNLSQRDWFKTLYEEMDKDNEIQNKRHKIATLGIIHPIAYSPMTRQAYNWIHTKAEEVGHLTPQNKRELETKYNNLISIYGGDVICDLFSKHTATKPLLNKVINWYGGYFIERAIHDTYTFDDIVNFKKNELTRTNKDLIKTIATKG